MRDRQLFLELGWIRLGDYAAECLGLSLRTVQDLIRTEEILAALPLTAAAFDAGHVSAAHVRTLGRVANIENERMWLARACRMDVRSLRRAVAAAIAREEAAGGPGAISSGTAGDAAPLPADGSPDTDGKRPSGVALLGGHRVASLGKDQEGDELELRPFSIPAPVWVISWWRDAVALARRLAGSSLPHGVALESVLAESRDVVGAGADSPRKPGADQFAGGAAPREQVGDQGWISLDVPHDDESPRGPASDGQGPEGSDMSAKARPAAPSLEAFVLEAELRRLVTERQSLEASLAERLGMDRAAGAHLLEGGGSFERYASRRYGISPRRIYYLLSLQRTLERLSALKRAHVLGRLTLRQTILVGKVATRRTAPVWIRRAERITLRRLEDEVEYWELLRMERPEVWERLKGYPLPNGIVLVPGHAPRLHAFARRGAVGDNGSSGFAARVGDDSHSTESDLHAFAHLDAHGSSGSSESRHATDEQSSASTRKDDTGVNETRTDLHAFAPPEPRSGSLTDTDDAPSIDAFSFIEALGASVAAMPLPARMGILRMRVEPETLEIWHDTVARFRALSSTPIEEWEVLVLVLRRFFQVWDNRETRRQRREHPILERDGWRCASPGCRSMGTGKLQTHHILFRSQGGTDGDPGLLVALCNGHHLHLLHDGYIRCSGRAPDALVWELGTGGNLPAWRIYRGDALVGGRALMPTAAAMGIAM